MPLFSQFNPTDVLNKTIATAIAQRNQDLQAQADQQNLQQAALRNALEQQLQPFKIQQQQAELQRAINLNDPEFLAKQQQRSIDLSNANADAREEAKLKTGIYNQYYNTLTKRLPNGQTVQLRIPVYNSLQEAISGAIQPQAAQDIISGSTMPDVAAPSIQLPESPISIQAPSLFGTDQTQINNVPNLIDASIPNTLSSAIANQFLPSRADLTKEANQSKIVAQQNSINAANQRQQNAIQSKNDQLANKQEFLTSQADAKTKGAAVDQDELASDVQAVLEGRNTAFNIRQSFGRSKELKPYMDALKKEINKVDPNFDFVASDAGGKLVSSPFYQKSITAIKAVEPNLDKIKELSTQVPRGDIKAWNNLLQKAGIQFGDKKISNFHEARNLISDELGVALGQGNVSDMKLQLGFDITDPSVSDEVFASNIDLIAEFLKNRKDALNSGRYASSKVVPNNSTTSKELTPEQAVLYLKKFGGDKQKAREAARKDGHTF